MSDFRNMGNANAALAQANFNQQDRLVDEFLHRIFRLVGEDAPVYLVDSYFNEERVIRMLDDMLADLPIPNDNIPPPADMSAFFRELLDSIQAVQDEDYTTRALIQQEDTASPPRAPSPSVSVSDDNEDMYVAEDAPNDRAQEDAKDDGSDGGSSDDDDKLVDNEAQHVPPGEESSDASTESEESSESGSSEDED
jgi:hypothetical protein